MNERKRNYVLLFADSVLFTNAMTFLSVNAVMTYFLSYLGASTFQIGLANSLVSLGAFISQPIFAKQAMNLSSKLKTFTTLLFIQRLFFLLFILSLPLYAVSHPQATVILFLICWTIFSFFVGSYSTFYMSLFAKMISEKQRGRLKGYSGGIGNLLALGSAVAIAYILENVAFPYNYTLLFSIGMVFLLLDVLTFVFMREEPDQITPLNINYFQYFKLIPDILSQNKKFRRIVIAYSLMVVSQVSLAYYALYAIRDFNAAGAQIALFAAITGIVNVLGNLIFGVLSDKLGHRMILIVSAICGCVAALLVVVIPQLWVVYVAFALSNLSLCGYNLSSGILIIDNVQREKLPMYISVNTVFTLVCSALITIGGSFLVDYISFDAVFLIAGMTGFISSWVLYRLEAKGRS
ncbi:MFS transporter [Paenibacillus agricola]|uniref:MFS transporter n=1 Tax=Paenibacillus agricola TaxID=2716264 RepID=A0ABX0IX79_9BACL|nr:MFS transporter [Paenibacillus agricola]NHN28283.1 MFS transporter [Paenibacillus agricola]